MYSCSSIVFIEHPPPLYLPLPASPMALQTDANYLQADSNACCTENCSVRKQMRFSRDVPTALVSGARAENNKYRSTALYNVPIVWHAMRFSKLFVLCLKRTLYKTCFDIKLRELLTKCIASKRIHHYNCY